MVDVPIPANEIVDPPARLSSPEFPWWNRDQCRTPMAWTGDPGAGFTTGRPWIRIGSDARRAQRGGGGGRPGVRPRDVSAAARGATRATRRSGVGRTSPLDVDDPDVFAWRRAGERSSAVVIVNFATDERRVVGPSGRMRPEPWPARTSIPRVPDLGRRPRPAAARGRHPRRIVTWRRPIALLRYGPDPLTPTGGARAARIPEAQGLGPARSSPRRSPRRRRPRSRCLRRSSPRTTSSSCTTPARAARASGCGPARTRWPSCRRCSTGWPRREIEVVEPLPIEFSQATPVISRPSEAMQWLNAHHDNSPVTRHALVVLETIDAVDLAFDTFVCTLLDGDVDTSGYPEYSAVVGGVASHWDESTGDMIVRAVVGWGGQGRPRRHRPDRREADLGHSHECAGEPVRPRAHRGRAAGARRWSRRPGLRPLRVRIGSRAGVLLPEVRHAPPARLTGASRARADLRLHVRRLRSPDRGRARDPRSRPEVLPGVRCRGNDDEGVHDAGNPLQGLRLGEEGPVDVDEVGDTEEGRGHDDGDRLRRVRVRRGDRDRRATRPSPTTGGTATSASPAGD